MERLFPLPFPLLQDHFPRERDFMARGGALSGLPAVTSGVVTEHGNSTFCHADAVFSCLFSRITKKPVQQENGLIASVFLRLQKPVKVFSGSGKEGMKKPGEKSAETAGSEDCFSGGDASASSRKNVKFSFLRVCRACPVLLRGGADANPRAGARHHRRDLERGRPRAMDG